MTEDIQQTLSTTTNSPTLDEKVDILQKTIDELKLQNQSTTLNKEDELTSTMRAKKAARLAAEQDEVENSFYLDVVADAKELLSENEDIIRLSKNIKSIPDRTNSIAKQIIFEAFGDTDDIRELVDNFKEPVNNSDSAFNAKYREALSKLRANKTSMNAALFNPQASDISIQDLMKKAIEATDYRTKHQARKFLQRNNLMEEK